MVDGISVREDVAELFNQMDFVFGFLDDGVEPQTHVGGHHVHQVAGQAERPVVCCWIFGRQATKAAI